MMLFRKLGNLINNNKKVNLLIHTKYNIQLIVNYHIGSLFSYEELY